MDKLECSDNVPGFPPFIYYLVSDFAHFVVYVPHCYDGDNECYGKDDITYDTLT